MSFLSDLGKTLQAGGQVASIFIPAVSPVMQIIGALAPGAKPVTDAVTNVGSELTAITQLVSQIEAIGNIANLDGTTKAKAIAPLVAQILKASPFMKDLKVVDQAKFLADCEAIAGSFADILNNVQH